MSLNRTYPLYAPTGENNALISTESIELNAAQISALRKHGTCRVIVKRQMGLLNWRYDPKIIPMTPAPKIKTQDYEAIYCHNYLIGVKKC